MTLSTNGITAERIREIKPPYQLGTDLLEAIFFAIRAPPLEGRLAWQQARAARLVHEVVGMMPAGASQARIAAATVSPREATDDTFARADAPGVTVEQVCRLLRTASALERSLVRRGASWRAFAWPGRRRRTRDGALQPYMP